MTFVGPVGQDPAFQNTTEYIKGNGLNPNNGSRLGQFQAAIQIRRNSHLSCFNSVAMGYPVGLLIENDKGSQTQEAAKNEVFKLNHIVFAGMGILGSDKIRACKEVCVRTVRISMLHRRHFLRLILIQLRGMSLIRLLPI